MGRGATTETFLIAFRCKSHWLLFSRGIARQFFNLFLFFPWIAQLANNEQKIDSIIEFGAFAKCLSENSSSCHVESSEGGEVNEQKVAVVSDRLFAWIEWKTSQNEFCFKYIKSLQRRRILSCDELEKLSMCFRCQSLRSRHATSQKNQSDGRLTTRHACLTQEMEGSLLQFRWELFWNNSKLNEFLKKRLSRAQLQADYKC